MKKNCLNDKKKKINKKLNSFLKKNNFLKKIKNKKKFNNNNKKFKKWNRKNKYRIREFFKTEILQVDRTAKVIRKGKLYTFRAVSIMGNSVSKIGLGIGKGKTVEEAINKSLDKAKKNVFYVKSLDFSTKTFKSPVIFRLKKTILVCKPNFSGFFRSNPLLYAIFRLSGFESGSVKCIGSRNRLNMIYSAFSVLKNQK